MTEKYTVEEWGANEWVNLAARVCHEANRSIQHHCLEDNPSPRWDRAPASQRASAIEGVINALNGQTPEELHDSWAKFKLADGWTYGPVKSEEYKQHPCLVPYEQLPEEQKLKDHVFQSIIRAFKDAVVIG